MVMSGLSVVVGPDQINLFVCCTQLECMTCHLIKGWAAPDLRQEDQAAKGAVQCRRMVGMDESHVISDLIPRAYQLDWLRAIKKAPKGRWLNSRGNQ